MKVIGNLTKDAIIRAAVSEGLTVTQAVGTDVTFNTGSTTGFAAAFDSNTGKVVIAYSDGTDGQRGKARVGTVDPSNNSISLGSAVTFQDSEITGDEMDCVFDSNANKVVIFYTDTNNPSTNSRTGTAIVGTVSGTSISFGTKAAFESGNTQHISACFDSNANKFVVAYKDAGNSDYGTSAVGTVSGTNISFGTPVVFNSANTNNTGAEFDSSNNKVVIAYRDQGASQQVTAIVGTVSGTSISYGSEVAVSSSSATNCDLIFDSSNNKMVLVYQDSGDASKGKAQVGTVSGTSISFGSAVVFNAGQSEYHRGVYDSNAGKIAIIYKDGGNSNRPTFISGTVSGTSITFDTETVLKDVEGVYQRPGIAYDSTNKRVVPAYLDATGSDLGITQVIRVGYSADTGGTIADGKAVIVNANGTVSSVSQSTRDQSVTSTPQFEAASVGYIASAYDSTLGKVIVAYRDQGNSGYGTAVVGTVASGEITFGTPVVFESASIEYTGATYDTANDKAVIVYTDVANSNRGTAIVGTVSGTSISFGSAVVFETQVARDCQAIFDNVNNKIVVAYRNSSENNRNYGIIGTVSGTSISFGSRVQYSETNNYVLRMAYIGNSKFVVSAQASDDTGHAYVGTVSGTSVSYGSKANVNGSNHAQNPGVAYDSTADKVVIGFRNSDDTTGGAVVGTVSGTSISFGSATNFGAVGSTGDNSNVSCVYDSVNDKTIVAFPDDSSSNKGTIKAGTVSGTSISFGDAIVFEQGGTKYITGVFDSAAERVVFAYEDDDDGDYGKAVVYQSPGTPSNLTSENFVGFMKGAALDGTNGEILSSCSIARNQTSLTSGQTYFVSPTDGALSTTAGSPSVTAGTAISSTELIVKG